MIKKHILFTKRIILFVLVSLEQGPLCRVSVVFVWIGLNGSTIAQAGLRSAVINLKLKFKAITNLVNPLTYTTTSLSMACIKILFTA